MNCPYIETCKKYRLKDCSLIANNFCMKLFKINQLQDLALLTEKQKQPIQLRLDADKKDLEAFQKLKYIENNIIDFIDKGENLYLYSKNTGNGKTSWGIKILNSYFSKIWFNTELVCKGLFINVPKFLISLKDNISQKSEYISHIKENVLNANLIIWDDIATKGFTQFEMENVLNIINNRIDSNKSNIYTSNLMGEELRESIGDRLYSRIYNNSQLIELVGVDKRGIR